VIEGVDSTELGATDKGADRERHVPPCTTHAWCTLARDHGGSCEVAPRREMPAPDFGPRGKP
jgi:hypothetical protein